MEGNGLFEVGRGERDENGDLVYSPAWTRNGAFKLSVHPADPTLLDLVTAEGYNVMSTANTPIFEAAPDHTLRIDAQGNIEAVDNYDNMKPPGPLGQLKMVGVMRPADA